MGVSGLEQLRVAFLVAHHGLAHTPVACQGEREIAGPWADRLAVRPWAPMQAAQEWQGRGAVPPELQVGSAVWLVALTMKELAWLQADVLPVHEHLRR